MIKIGKEALKFTNEFRAKHGKPPLKWHQVGQLMKNFI